jgi:CHAT domain-containing protein/tetratricopeptide (TPR) repeat protein
LETAKVLDLLVESLWRGGKVKEPESRQLAARVVAIKEKNLGPDHPEVAKSLRNFGVLMNLSGEYTQAKQLAERALRIRENALGPDHPDVAMSLRDLGDILDRTGDFAAARPLLERALEIQEKVLGHNDPELALTLTHLGVVRWRAGNYPEAKALLERARTISEKTLGPDHPETASALGNLANLYSDSGDYTTARQLEEQVLAIREKALGPNHPSVAIAVFNLGISHALVGDQVGARALYERALAIDEKAYGPDHPYVAGDLAAIGSALNAMGDYRAAKPLFERALPILEKAMGPESYEVAEALDGLAAVLDHMGDPTKGQQLAQRSVALYEKLLGPEHPQVAHEICRLADLQLENGDFRGARALFGRALKIRETALGLDNPRTAATLSGLAQALAGSGEPGAALDAALRAEGIGREHLRLTARTLAERESLLYAAERTSGLDARTAGLGLALTLTVENPDIAPQSIPRVWDAIVRSRALVLDEMAERHHATAGLLDPDIARLDKQLGSARERLAHLVLRGPRGMPSDRYHTMLDKARQEKEQAERMLAEKSVAFREEQARSQVGLNEVVAALPAQGALLAFVRYGRHKLGQTPTGRTPEPTPSYAALVLRSGGAEPYAVALGDAEVIDALVSRWREQMTQEAMAPGHTSKRAETTYRTTAAELRRRVWDPVARYVGDSKRVFIVPDGALNLVNFAALPIGQTSYLIEKGPVIHYLSAERDLVVTPSEQKNQGLFALGGPAFDDTGLFASLARPQTGPAVAQAAQVAAPQVYRGNRSACGSFQSMRFDALPGSRRETDQIVGLWESATLGKTLAHPGSAALAPMPDVIYLKGSEASETAFKQRAPGHRVLHLATHGFFLGGRCASALHASDTPQEQSQSIAGENPLLLSGLVLAGANHRQAAGPEEDDGILTAEEIAAMDLEGVEWAVLSGCDTGVGEIQAGEGVFGLRRAFQIAGAHTVIMSLWPVEDTTARQWMTTLYRQRFVRGLSTADSVREASLTVLRQRRAKQQSTHPFYWGSFVAAGDWR